MGKGLYNATRRDFHVHTSAYSPAQLAFRLVRHARVLSFEYPSGVYYLRATFGQHERDIGDQD
jgi:hypothetical protein